MNDQPVEPITLDVVQPEQFLRRVEAEISRDKARTANTVTIILVASLLASLPVYLAIVPFVDKENIVRIDAMFDRWYHVVSPLAGAAVGAYYVSRGMKQRQARR